MFFMRESGGLSCGSYGEYTFYTSIQLCLYQLFQTSVIDFSVSHGCGQRSMSAKELFGFSHVIGGS